MNNKYIDFHCHKKIAKNLSEKVLAIYSQDALSQYGVVEVDQNDYFTIGIHPWNLDSKISNELLESIFTELKDQVKNDKCLLIGETGLDAVTCKDKILFEKQRYWLIQHLNLAQEINKSVVLHSVRSTSEILNAVGKTKFKNNLFFHNFNGNEQEINQLLKTNAYFSLGQNLFSKNSKISKHIKKIPLEKIFLESDDGRFSIIEVYKKASQLLNIEEDLLREKIQSNFNNLNLF